MASPYNNNADQYISLAGLEVPGLPETLDAAGDGFIRKAEFHITLFAVGKTAQLIDDKRTEELRPRLVEEFYQFAGSQPLTGYELSDDVRLVQVDGNKTIVVMAALKGIEEFFTGLSRKHGVEIPVQPTHITLYTLPSDTFGIPITSYQELADISEPIKVQAITEALKG